MPNKQEATAVHCGHNTPHTVTISRVHALNFNTAHVARSTLIFVWALKKVCRGHTDLHESIARRHIPSTQRTLQTAAGTPATARSSGLETGTDPMRHTATVRYLAIWPSRLHLLVESPTFSSMICIATSSRQLKVTRQTSTAEALSSSTCSETDCVATAFFGE